MEGIMTSTEAPKYEKVEEWQANVAAEIPRMLTFNLDNLDWMQVTSTPDGATTGIQPDSELVGVVDFEKFYAQGMWTAFVDAGAFNVLGVKLAANYTIPRHHHNMHQLVFVHEGEIWQGNRSYHAGDVYFTRAFHPYSVTAGPEGSIAFELRVGPIGELQTIWDEQDPAKWVHGRRPGGPASASKAQS
jgi:hypothetical protein